MKVNTILVRAGGIILLGVFGINLYIGLYDTNLSELSLLHSELNWLIAAADLIAAIILFVKPGSLIWKSLTGIVWPIVYVANLFVDVETRLCLGSSASTCSPTVSDAYKYLILGSAGEEWLLWPYTIRLAIVLVIAVLILTCISEYFRANRENGSPRIVQKSLEKSQSNPNFHDKIGR